MKKIIFSAFIFPLVAGNIPGLSDIDKVREWRKANEHQVLAEYFEFLSIPNSALDRENIQKNAEFIAAVLRKIGVEPRLLPSATPGTPPAVYGEVRVPGAARTIVFYAHYDGQPAIPENWHPDIKPFQPVFLSHSIEKGGSVLPRPKPGEAINPEWRISGRSSSDDKAGVMLILNAYKALTESNIQPTSNIKFFFEGEEEIGSVHLSEIRNCYGPTSGSSPMALSISPACPCWISGCVAMSIWRSRSMAPNGLFTADTTATGRPIPPCGLPNCSLR